MTYPHVYNNVAGVIYPSHQKLRATVDRIAKIVIVMMIKEEHAASLLR
jgi:hypothetical protein